MRLSTLSPFSLISVLILGLLFSACAENPLSPSVDEAVQLLSPETETTLNQRVTTLESQVATLQTRVNNLEGRSTPSDPYVPVIPTTDPEPKPVTPSAPVDINNASLEELQALNGIGPVKAQRILNFITLNGPITDPRDLLSVKGIGPKTMMKIEVDIDILPPSEDSPVADSDEE